MIHEPPSEQKSQIESIFHEARERAPKERAIYLDGACHGDAATRQAVEALLEADAGADELFRVPAEMIGTVASEPAMRQGTVIGRYKLLEQVGEGGFGAVYMAEQVKPIRRKVALKIIKPGMDSKEVITRFEAERQTLAMMDHPSIAKVLDAGMTEAGRPYFVMELVNGVSITEYCDANHLDTKSRLELFRLTCCAVQHAHQKGVIHRDLKPSNVMVTKLDGKPVPKVIDFGVSKALSHPLTEATLFTRYGQIVGTPQYMSPEQAEMSGQDIDTRSDIYSLGVLLYELITGRAPLELSELRKASFEAICRKIRESEPTKPSIRIRALDEETASSVASCRSTQPAALCRSVSGDLDWIILKSLEKDRNRRYDSANGLVRDIERYLHHEAVEAGPPTARYRMRKFVQRHQVAAALGGFTLAVFLAAFTLIAAAWLQAAEAATVAEKEAKRANDSLDILTTMISNARPRGERGSDIPVSEFLGHFADQLDESPFEDELVEIKVRQTLGRAFHSFSLGNLGGKQFDRAKEIIDEMHPEPSLQRARLLIAHIKAISPSGGPVSLLKETLGILQQDGGTVQQKIEVLSRLGEARSLQRDLAEEHFREACNLADALPDSEREKLVRNPYHGFASILIAQDKLNDATATLVKATELAESANQTVVAIQSKLLQVRIHSSKREFDRAERLADQVVREAISTGKGFLINSAAFWRIQIELLHLPDEKTLGVAQGLAKVVIENWEPLQQSDCAHLLGGIAGAIIVFESEQAASELIKRVELLPAQRRFIAHRQIGQWLLWAGEMQRADQKAADVFASRNHKSSTPALWDLIYRQRAHTGVRDFEKSIQFLRQARQLCTEAKRVDRWTLNAIEFELGLLLERAGQTEESKQLFASCFSGMSEESERTWGAVTIPAFVLAALKSDKGSVNSNERVRSSILELKNGISTFYDLPLALRHAVLGLIDEEDGNVESAIRYFEKAVEDRQGSFQPLYFEWVTDHLVELMTDSGQLEKLESILREDMNRRDRQLLEHHPERAFTRIRLVELLISTNRDLTDAPELLEEASAVYDHHGDFLPQTERERLNRLIEQVSDSSNEGF